MAKYDRTLDRIFQALADPTRRAMLARLAQGPLAVSALAGPTGLALPTVLRHLSVLQQAGLIDTHKTGRTRLCHAQPDALSVPADWLARHRADRGARTDQLEARLATLMEHDDDPVQS